MTSTWADFTVCTPCFFQKFHIKGGFCLHLFAETTLSACCIQVLYYDKLPSNPWYQWYLPITFTLLPCHPQRRGELSRREAFNFCMTQLLRGEVSQKFQGVFSHQWMLQVWDGFVFVPPCHKLCLCHHASPWTATMLLASFCLTLGQTNCCSFVCVCTSLSRNSQAEKWKKLDLLDLSFSFEGWCLHASDAFEYNKYSLV